MTTCGILHCRYGFTVEYGNFHALNPSARCRVHPMDRRGLRAEGSPRTARCKRRGRAGWNNARGSTREYSTILAGPPLPGAGARCRACISRAHDPGARGAMPSGVHAMDVSDAPAAAPPVSERVPADKHTPTTPCDGSVTPPSDAPFSRRNPTSPLRRACLSKDQFISEHLHPAVPVVLDGHARE